MPRSERLDRRDPCDLAEMGLENCLPKQSLHLVGSAHDAHNIRPTKQRADARAMSPTMDSTVGNNRGLFFEGLYAAGTCAESDDRRNDMPSRVTFDARESVAFRAMVASTLECSGARRCTAVRQEERGKYTVL